MNARAILLAILGLAVVAPDWAWSQPGYMRRGPKPAADSAAEDEKEEKPKAEKPKRPARRKVKNGEPVPSGTDKASIEAYLQSRLKELKGTHKDRGVFGGKMKVGWDKFWDQLHEDRKQFEINMARQRLNLFDTLSSLDPTKHAATIRHFEQLQDTQIKGFEDDVKGRMDGYFKQLGADLREFALKQEKERMEFQSQAEAAWRAQRAGANGNKK